MNKKRTLAIIFCLLLSVISVSAITFTTENWVRMILETHVSLGNFTGNSTHPNVEEDDMMVLNFLIPPSEDSSKLKLSFDADCINGGANATENYYLDVYCLDGSYNVIDLSQADCENLAYSDLPSLWINIENVTGQSIVSDVSYNKFWCAFKRNITNTQRIPTEFKVVVDSLGLTSPSEDLNVQQQRSSITNVAQGISDFVGINIQVWRILFNIFEIMVLLTAFIGLPIVMILIIKWAINKIKGV